MDLPLEILHEKREKFRVNIRKANNENTFKAKRQIRYESHQYGIQDPNDSLTKVNFLKEQLNISGANLDLIKQLIDVLIFENENMFHYAKVNKIHLDILQLNSVLLPSLLKYLSNFFYYFEDCIHDLIETPNIDFIDCICQLACQHEKFTVSDYALGILGNITGDTNIPQPKKILLENKKFFEFWVDYFERDQNMECKAKRSSRLAWIITNLSQLKNQEFQRFAGPFVILKLIIMKVGFQNCFADTTKDVLESLKKIIKMGTQLDIEDIFESEFYEETLQIVKVAQGQLEAFQYDASKVLFNIYEIQRLGTNSLTQLYGIGLKSLFRYLLIDTGDENNHVLGLRILQNFFDCNNSYLIDSIFEDLNFDKDFSSLLLNYLQHLDNYVVLNSLIVISKAIDNGGLNTYKKLIADNLINKLSFVLQESSYKAINQALNIFLNILQKDEILMQSEMNVMINKIKQENLIPILEDLTTKFYDEELLQQANSLLDLLTQNN